MSGQQPERLISQEPDDTDGSYWDLVEKSLVPAPEDDTNNRINNGAQASTSYAGDTGVGEGSRDEVLDRDLLLSEINATVASIPEENLERFLSGFRLVAADALAPHPKPQSDQAAVTQAADVALTWPSDKWKDADEKILGKKFGIITFLRKVWEPFIEKTGAVVTREILAAHDPDAEQALTRFLERHEMPKGISILHPHPVIKILNKRPELAQVVLSALGIPNMR